MLKKRVASLIAVAAIGGLSSIGGASADSPVATTSKYCSAYAEEHFGDRNAETPSGVECLGPGEYCSHKPGWPAAYRRAGFVCDREGRLKER